MSYFSEVKLKRNDKIEHKISSYTFISIDVMLQKFYYFNNNLGI